MSDNMTEITRIKEQNERRKYLHENEPPVDSMKFVEAVYELKDINRTITDDISSLITTIESQKEEIEGYKTITELAVNGLKRVAEVELKDFPTLAKFILKGVDSTLSEIERLQNAQT